MTSEIRGKASVTVRIGGEDHVIRANVEPEYTIRCAEWVDTRITEIRRQLGLIESHKAAILAALSITDELFQLQAEMEDLRESAAREARRLGRQLEAALEEPEEAPVGEEEGTAVPGPADASGEAERAPEPSTGEVPGESEAMPKAPTGDSGEGSPESERAGLRENLEGDGPHIQQESLL